MFGLEWGKAQQLSFADDHEYYRALGSLCRHDAYTITFETNSETESWGDAFRIKCLMGDNQIPDAFFNAMRTARRINCNDYVQNLYSYHSFDFDVANKVLIGDYEKVRRTVPSEYYYDFDEGYRLNFTHYNRKTPLKRIQHQQRDTVVHSHAKMDVVNPSKAEQTTPPTIKPMPQPVSISVGEYVVHKAWGEGQICSIDGNYFVVLFPNLGEKKFSNPDTFERGFLKKKL